MGDAGQERAADELIDKIEKAWSRQHQSRLQVTQLRRLSAGASADSFHLSATIDGGQDVEMVLQLFASARQFPGALGKVAQGHVARLAAASGITTPEVLLFTGPGDGLPEGFATRFQRGETVGRRIVTAEALAPARAQLTAQCARELAAIHALPVADFDMLHPFGARAQLDLLAGLHRDYGQPIPVFELAIQWLKAHLPGEYPEVVVHGDFRVGNLIVDDGGLVAVLDWEMAHIGDPMEDLAWLCIRPWRFGRLDLAMGGIGTRQALYEAYAQCGESQVDAARLRFWEVLGTLKWGVICQWFLHDTLASAQPSLERLAIGRRVSEVELDLLEVIEGHDCQIP
ncbi:MAG: phosphotransferase family protein [Gammaproteobacteria bacterium]|nr:phosphotransferase family protein [Gammaproteobacteria bacterium]